MRAAQRAMRARFLMAGAAVLGAAVLGATVVVGSVYIGLNLLSDLLYRLFDPRAHT